MSTKQLVHEAAQRWVPIWAEYVKSVEDERDALKLLNVELREALDQFCGFIAAGCAEVETIEGYRPTLTEIERKARALLTRSTDRR
jgi:hypothetical protein